MLRSVFRILAWSAVVAAALTFGTDQLARVLTANSETKTLNPASLPEVGQQAQNWSVKEKTDTKFRRVRADFEVAIPTHLSERYLISGPFSYWNALLGFPSAGAFTLAFASTHSSDGQVGGLPLPQPRPSVSDSGTQAEVQTLQQEQLASADFNTGIFDRLLRLGPRATPPPPDEARGRTAVYNIQARTVYLPSGEVLEAHSGLGELMDDVRYIREKGRGPTPPNQYSLSLRKASFHGVQALRLTPFDRTGMFGRDGMLVHPYMLGANGESNGCVSIQQYSKFLQAYLRGEIDRLIVVPGNGTAPADPVNAREADGKVNQFRPI